MTNYETYKQMWDVLKNSVIGAKRYYEDGSMCSMAESIQGEKDCDEFLSKMNRIEKMYLHKEN